MPDFEQDKLKVAQSAFQLRQQDFLILDTETTGLGADAEICEIAITDSKGRILFSSLVKPVNPIPTEAMAVHKISNVMVAEAPPFSDLYLTLLNLLKGKTVLIYNAQYDLGVLHRCCTLAQSPWINADAFIKAFTAIDVMMPYSTYCGEWNDYHGSYTWQKLPGGDHTAAGDCKATAEIVRQMASFWVDHLYGQGVDPWEGY